MTTAFSNGADIRETGRYKLLFVLWLAVERQDFGRSFGRGIVEVVGVRVGHEDRVNGAEVEFGERNQGVAAVIGSVRERGHRFRWAQHRVD